MADLIASDSFLTEEQTRTLKVLLNLMIPPDADRGMPGAAELDFVGYVCEFASNYIDAIVQEIEALDAAARGETDTAFADLDETNRQALVDQLRAANARFAQAIVVQTLSCYYQDDTVVTALGWEARPPFPKGNEVVGGDLSLLDPVRKRGKMYRE